MDDIEHDPIVIYYLKLTDGGQKQDQDDAKLDVTFSEISLRLALIQLLGKNILNPANVRLYRKIILLYFSYQITDVEQLITYMSPCFDEATVRYLLTPERREQILKEWKEFKASKLIDIVYKNATIAMLKEYHHRLTVLLNGNVHLTLDCVKIQLQNALNFLHWNMKHHHKFSRMMLNQLNDKNIHCINNNSMASEAMTSSQSLEMSSIFEAIKDTLNPWLVRMVKDGGEVNQLIGDVLKDSAVSRKKYRARSQTSKCITYEVEEVRNIVSEEEEEMPKTSELLSDAAPNETMDADVCSSLGINATNIVHEIKIEETTSNPDIRKENTDHNSEQRNAASYAEEGTKCSDYIGFDTAISYVNELKEYALDNELFDIVVLVDQLEDSLLS